MKATVLLCLVITPSFASLPVAAQIAAPSAQYTLEGTAPAPAPRPAAPIVFSRKVWPKVELADGRIFERVRVLGEDSATVTLIHAGGVAKVDKRMLPEEIALLHPYVPGAAQVAAAQAEARRQAAAAGASLPATLPAPAPVYPPRPTPAPAPAPVVQTDLNSIETAVKIRARRYFETEKRLGSGQTLSFDVFTDVSEPEQVPGWSDRWAVTGTAGYKVYESIGGGGFSKRSTKFSAIAEAAPGKKVRIVSFEER